MFFQMNESTIKSYLGVYFKYCSCMEKDLMQTCPRNLEKSKAYELANKFQLASSIIKNGISKGVHRGCSIEKRVRSIKEANDFDANILAKEKKLLITLLAESPRHLDNIEKGFEAQPETPFQDYNAYSSWVHIIR